MGTDFGHCLEQLQLNWMLHFELIFIHKRLKLFTSS